MRISLHGTTRIVILCGRVAIKIPNFTRSWLHFLKGVVGNMMECQTWRWNSGKFEEGKSRLLCPVLFMSWGGWMLIMRRVDKVLTYDDYWGLEEGGFG